MIIIVELGYVIDLHMKLLIKISECGGERPLKEKIKRHSSVTLTDAS